MTSCVSKSRMSGGVVRARNATVPCGYVSGRFYACWHRLHVSLAATQRQLARLRAEDRWANVGLTEEHTTPYSKYIKACGSISPCGRASVCSDTPGNRSMQRMHQGMTLLSSGVYTLFFQDDDLPAALRPATLKRKLQLDDVPGDSEVPESKCEQVQPAQEQTAAEQPPAADAAACSDLASTQSTAVPPESQAQPADASAGVVATAPEAKAASSCRPPSAPKPQASSVEAQLTEAQMQTPLDAVVPSADDEPSRQEAAAEDVETGGAGEAEEAQEVLPEPRAPTGRRLRPATRWQDNDAFDAQVESRAHLCLRSAYHRDCENHTQLEVR